MITLTLTEEETDLLVGGATGMAIQYAGELLAAGMVPDADDYDTLWKFQSIGKKAQRAVGMPDETLFQILAATYGQPDDRVQALLIEAQRQCGGRTG